jgi:hypothetical protein
MSLGAILASYRALLLQDAVDLAGARPLFERALAINEKVLGPEHPATSRVKTNSPLRKADLTSLPSSVICTVSDASRNSILIALAGVAKTNGTTAAAKVSAAIPVRAFEEMRALSVIIFPRATGSHRQLSPRYASLRLCHLMITRLEQRHLRLALTVQKIWHNRN